MNIQTLTSPEPYHLKASANNSIDANTVDARDDSSVKEQNHFRTLKGSYYLSNSNTDTAIPYRPLLSPLHQPLTLKVPQQSVITAPATASTTIATATAYSSSNNRIQYTAATNNNAMNDLQSVVSKYQANPELLRLILASKVEEDKRRTEEAKLKAKELDLYLKQQHIHSKSNNFSQSSSRRNSNGLTSSNADTSLYTSTASTAVPYSLAPNNRSNNMSQGSPKSPLLPSSLSSPRRNSINSTIFRNRSRSINSPSRTAVKNLTSTAIVPLNSPPDHYSTYQQPQHDKQQPSALPQQHHHTLSLPLHLSHPPLITSSSASLLPQSACTNTSTTTTVNSRRRRSIQAITKLIETTEYPYNDHYFWKNNGNTIQKKTGLKSTYYKCANSIKGCPVNKTVVEQPNGKYLIKYRGEHIHECSQFEHIRDL